MKVIVIVLLVCGSVLGHRQRCPANRPIVDCIAHPCVLSSCPAYPNAICRSNTCGGCSAEWYVGGRKVNCRTSCPNGLPRVNCIHDPCLGASCPAYPQAQCRPNYCGGCSADWYVGRRKVNCRTSCPNGLPRVNCIRDPCLGASCPAYPQAQCRANYCGGCNAEWYVGGRKVQCSSCPPGSPVVRCRRDPCFAASCPAYPRATCRPNYCGGCNADWYVGSRKVNCRTSCPNGLPRVNCIHDPCHRASCPAYPQAECRPNYCGRCNAEWYVGGRKVQCSGCPPGSPVVRCGRDPCFAASCPAYPRATCRINPCQLCIPHWYNKNGEEVNCRVRRW